MATDMILMPRSQLGRVAKTRKSKNGRILREWFYTGIPTVVLQTDPIFGVVDALFTIPMDVPSKPRTTQKSTWSPSYQNYLNWRSYYRKAIKSALAMAGCPLVEHLPVLPSDSLFYPALAHEPVVGRSKAVYDPPIVMSGLILTKYEGDADNRIKAVLDASNGLLFPDDRCVCWPSFPVLAAGKSDALCQVRIQYVPLEGRRARILALAGSFPSFWPPPKEDA